MITPVANHLLRAWVDWFNENKLEPIHISAITSKVNAPDITKDWKGDAIILDLAPSKIRDLVITQDTVSFSAWKSGPVDVSFPIDALMSIRIPSDGDEALLFTFFHFEPILEPSDDPPPAVKRPSLSIVK